MKDLSPNLPAAPAPRPTAQVAPYVEVLGMDLAVTFLLTFGGADLYLPTDPKGKSEVEALIGAANLAALAARRNAPRSGLQSRVPLAKRWLTEVLHWQGHSNAAIARKLRISTTSVARYLAKVYSEGKG